MKILVDMNLAPSWCALLDLAGWESRHWSNVGAHDAADREIMVWARTHGHVVMTLDLDFSTILALTAADGPSVIQLRAEDVLPDLLGTMIVTQLRAHEADLERGALLTIDGLRGRIRLLPLRS